ncbi:isochorismatase family protein [Actinoplanes sp. TBRC 11911]|uniref:isochorismatase family protein n=1 Tax=Actinoplanes sp. TBRC 11911 TaxID=2729386 RepID=UPI00145E4963|nr:isochorismatase family protein [Actinoplanes sp. TBRC 11911]NMO53298.1 isochorismatase family protein [Actinoplanes sp. TBRC 11911]
MTVTTIDPKTALIVIDLQAGIVGAPTVPYPAADVVARTAELAAAFRERGLPVVLVHVSTAPDGSDWAPGRIEGGAQRMTRPDGWDVIVDEVRGPGDIIVTKRNWGAFYGTDLDLHLRRRGVTQIVLTGIATAIGVESTARSAHEHGYNVTVAVDAVSDLNEETHQNSIEKIFPRLGEVGTTADIIDLVKKSS